MKILNIGGATAILEHQGKRILFDPWMNEGILHGSWHHWPPLNVKLSDIGRLDYIYISHIHEDHCAPDTIRHLNRDAEIIIMDREPEVPNFIKKFLKYNHFEFKKVHLVRPRSPVEICDGLMADMVTADPKHEYNYLIDSGLILKWGDYVIYNANDCAPYEESISYIKRRYEKVDLALLPYAGGSGYPGCYSNLSHEEKLRERDRIYEQRIKLFATTIREIDPKFVMPFADQYVIGGNRGNLNPYSPHPPCPGMIKSHPALAGLESKLLLLNSGQTYDLESKTMMPSEPYRTYSESDRDKYIESLSEKAYDFQKVVMRDAIPVDRLLSHARSRLWGVQKKQNKFPECVLYFHITNLDRTFKVDFRSSEIEEISAASELQQPYIKMSMDTTLFTMLLVNHISWNMADGALFIDYERRPNIYDPGAYALVNHLIV